MSSRSFHTISKHGGNVMFALCLAIAPSYYNDWAHSHNAVVLRIMVACCIAMIGFYAVSFFTKDRSPTTPPTPLNSNVSSPINSSGNSAGGNNHGVQAVIEKAYFGSTPSVSEVREAPPPKRPNLVSHGAREVRSGEFGFVVEGSSSPFFVISVENQLKDDGEPICKAECICARLHFTGEPKVSALVPKAFWLNFSGNEIKIPIGEIRSVVLGTLHNGEWFFCQNEQQFPLSFHQLRSGYFELENSQPKSIPFLDGFIDVEVIWFSRIGGVPLLKENYRITKTGPNLAYVGRPV